LLRRLGAVPLMTGVLVTESDAALPVTPLERFDNVGGHYLVTFALRLTVAATTSSGALLTVAWTENGQARSRQSASLNTNAITQYDSATFLIQTDPNTPITAAVTYVSIGATAMRYRSSVYALRMPR
jgi:hypothetical protein